MPVTALSEALAQWLTTEWHAQPLESRKLFTGGGKEYVISAELPDGTRVRIDVKELTPPP